VYKRRLESGPGGGERRANSGVTASSDDEIEASCVRGLVGELKQRPSQESQLGAAVWGNETFRNRSEKQSVATAFEASQVLQFKLGYRAEADDAAVAPSPGAVAFDAKGFRSGDAIDEDAKGSRPMRRSPIASPDPKAIFARAFNGNGSLGVRDRPPQAVS